VQCADAIAAQARQQGIALDTLHYCCWVQSPRPPALLLGYAAIPEHTHPASSRAHTGSLARSRTNAACSQTPIVRQVSMVAWGSATTLQVV
jgi:hypothetical protein